MQQHTIQANATLRDALGKLNALPGGSMTLFALTDDGRVCGTVTDGDLRRALLAGCSLESPVSLAMHRNFRSLGHGRSADDVDTLRACRQSGIALVPRLDADGRLDEIIDLNRTHTRLPLSAILMAGGKGERLRPLTSNCPKPLLEIDGKAIIDYNIEALARCGISDITVTTRYLAERIHAHFSRPVAGVSVRCVEETEPLGTIGSVTLVDLPDTGDTLVMNSDLLTTISFEELYLKHRDSGADITIAAIPYQVTVPFAILTLQDDMVRGIEEKPSYSHYANAGIYIFSNRVLRTLQPGRRTDAPDLIAETIARGGRVAYYVIKGTWLDVGSPTDFRQAGELMRHHRNLTSNN